METIFNEVAQAPESAKPKHRKFVAAMLVAFLFVGLACWYIHHPNRPRTVDPKPGTFCTVQFRRDALGGAANLPVSPTTTNINGATVSLQGELIAVSHDAILLDQVNDHYIVSDVPQMKRFWIPRSSILSIEYEPARTFPDLPQDNILRIRYEAKQRAHQRTTTENQ